LPEGGVDVDGHWICSEVCLTHHPFYSFIVCYYYCYFFYSLSLLFFLLNCIVHSFSLCSGLSPYEANQKVSTLFEPFTGPLVQTSLYPHTEAATLAFVKKFGIARLRY
jgi:hypothetical protein